MFKIDHHEKYTIVAFMESFCGKKYAYWKLQPPWQGQGVWSAQFWVTMKQNTFREFSGEKHREKLNLSVPLYVFQRSLSSAQVFSEQ